MKRALVAVGLTLTALAGCGALLMMLLLSSIGTPATSSSSDCAPALDTDGLDGSRQLYPGATPQIRQRQEASARAILAEAQRLRLPLRGQVIAIMVALVESQLIPGLTEAQSDRDSAGLFQQRRPWGSIAERLDPAASTRLFINGGRGGQRGLLDIPKWQSLPPGAVAQAVQVSAFGGRYALQEARATRIVTAIGGSSVAPAAAASSSCVDATDTQPVSATASHCADSGLSAERSLQPAALQVLRCVHAAWPKRISTYYGAGFRAANSRSDHPAGRAVDAMIPNWQSASGHELGNAVAAYIQRNAKELDVSYIIWDARIWSPSRAGEGWRPYTHPSGATDPTSAHRDHVHVSVNP